MLQLNLSLLSELQMVVSALILLTAFIFLMQNRIYGMINTFAWQSSLLVIAAVLQGIITYQYEFFISASITLILKVLFIPYLMRYLVKRLNFKHKVSTITHPFLLLLSAVVLVLFCYYLTTSITSKSFSFLSNVTSVAMAVTLLGMLLLVTHRKAISHVVGFMSMENGIFFAALVAAHGMPMVVELGIAFDVLVAAVLFGVFFFHLRSSIDSLDVDNLNLLREDNE